MGNCCKRFKKPRRNIVLLLVGLDNAGKTVTAKSLAHENISDSIPTIGFSVVNLKYLGNDVKIYDLGGGENIRGIWHRYFVDAHGIIFVIDAADYTRFEEVQIVLTELLSHDKISGKPLLILANKQDNSEAIDEIDIVEILQLENLVNEKKCPTLVESCSATEINAKENKLDPGIENGYRWLINYILKEYDYLNERVEADVAEQKIIEDKQRKEKIERLKLSQTIDNSEENIDESNNHVNPFKPISELVNEKLKLVKKRDNKVDIINSPASSVKSAQTSLSTSTIIENSRPKSATQIIKTHLEKTQSRRNSYLTLTNNKTAPITLLSPKSAPLTRHFDGDFEVNMEFRSASQTGQILTVTELPNAIIDANGENIGDLFELNNFPVRKLPPIRQKSIYDCNSWLNKSINQNGELQNNVDEIYKDIS